MFLKNGIPEGLDEITINSDLNCQKKEAWMAHMIRSIKEINDCSGFNVSGWVRRGMVEDQFGNSIPSSELKIHVTNIEINMKGDNKPDISKYLYDLVHRPPSSTEYRW